MRHRVKLGVGLPAAIMLLALAFPAAAPAAGPLPPADDLADAARFRESFGFPTDVSTLTDAALNSARYPNAEYGVPLTTAEAAEVERRLKIQEGLDETPVFAASLPNSAGTYVDHRAGGIPVSSS